MPSDDAIDDDVFGDDDDGGRGALNWGTCKGRTVRVHAPLFLPNSPHFTCHIFSVKLLRDFLPHISCPDFIFVYLSRLVVQTGV